MDATVVYDTGSYRGVEPQYSSASMACPSNSHIKTPQDPTAFLMQMVYSLQLGHSLALTNPSFQNLKKDYNSASPRKDDTSRVVSRALSLLPSIPTARVEEGHTIISGKPWVLSAPGPGPPFARGRCHSKEMSIKGKGRRRSTKKKRDSKKNKGFRLLRRSSPSSSSWMRDNRHRCDPLRPLREILGMAVLTS
ncbi:hypothetical protein MUK42_33517 [Musa troglodytarum]|uniref:Uncharacterized protein n=1 Tax=Musa troglodytarum TaxID=320322 RepID=A0A9E7JSP2_9LILI|nr:hypothetical protein MUK42_33517 [Musa troglodytarum]